MYMLVVQCLSVWKVENENQVQILIEFVSFTSHWIKYDHFPLAMGYISFQSDRITGSISRNILDCKPDFHNPAVLTALEHQDVRPSLSCESKTAIRQGSSESHGGYQVG